MNPFSKYLDCLNCENELISINELTFRTPERIECDYCGQHYPGLESKVKKTKTIINIAFLMAGLFLFFITWQITGIVSGLFALFPLFVIYLFTLGFAIKKNSGFH